MAATTSSSRSHHRLPKTITLYLVLYNAVLCLGWSIVLVLGSLHWLRHGTHVGLFSAISIPLYIFQTAAIMEVFHCAVGFVRSSVFLTGFQVASRLFLVWAILYSVPEVQDSIGVAAAVAAWSVTEVIRYLFYVCSLVSVLPYALQWCRYTFFFFLYPIGVTGELVAIYASLPFVQKSGIYSVALPNPLNVGFSYYFFLIAVMLSYIPIFPQLYFHMIGQRRKVLSSEPRGKKD